MLYFSWGLVAFPPFKSFIRVMLSTEMNQIGKFNKSVLLFFFFISNYWNRSLYSSHIEFEKGRLYWNCFFVKIVFQSFRIEIEINHLILTKSTDLQWGLGLHNPLLPHQLKNFFFLLYLKTLNCVLSHPYFVLQYGTSVFLNIPRKISPEDINPGTAEAKLLIHLVLPSVSLVL